MLQMPTLELIITGSIGTKDNGKGGIQKVHRVPFEAVIDPVNRLDPNKIDTVDVYPDLRIRERFVFYDNEVHPSSSLSPQAFQRSKLNPNTALEPNLYNFGPHGRRTMVWGTPATSSALSCSIDLSVARSQPYTTYTKAANNFYAECMRFFLDGGQTTIMSSADSLQEVVDYGKKYKMKIRLSAPRAGADFPIYNRASAFGVPVDAGPPNQKMPYGRAYHGFSPYTPPHYDEYAEVEYIFDPGGPQMTASSGERVEFNSIESVLAAISADNRYDERGPSIKYNRYIRATASFGSGVAHGVTDNDFGEGSVDAATGSFNKSHAMQLSAS